MTNLEGARVGFIHQAVKTKFNIELAKSLKSKFNVVTCFFVTNESSLAHLKSIADGAIDEFELISYGKQPLPLSELIQKAKHFEERYCVPIGWFKLMIGQMALVFRRGFCIHAQRMQRMFQMKISWPYIHAFEYWEDLYQKKSFSLLINGYFFEYFPSTANGVPVRTALSARNENFYIWTHDCYGQLPSLETVFSEKDGSHSVISDLQTPTLNSEQLVKLSKHSNVITLFKKLARVFIKWSYRQYKRDKHKTYKLGSELGYFLREWWRLRSFDKAKLPTLTDLRDTRFILYALQVEPETNFQGFSQRIFSSSPPLLLYLEICQLALNL